RTGASPSQHPSPMTIRRSSRPPAATLRTTASARGVAVTLTVALQPDDLVPELLLLGGDLVDADVFGLQVLLQAPRAVLAADPGLLVAAEGRRRRHQVVVVHPHGPGADALGHLERARDVARPHRAAQPVDRVVGHPN